MHALVFAHQPHQAAVHLALIESDEVPEVGVEMRKRLVRAFLVRGHGFQIVPFLAGGLARFAADARRGVDVLGDHGLLAQAGLGTPHGGGGAFDLERLYGHDRLLTPFPGLPGTLCTPASRCSDRRRKASRNSPAVLCGPSPPRSPSEWGIRCARCPCRRSSTSASGW